MSEEINSTEPIAESVAIQPIVAELAAAEPVATEPVVAELAIATPAETESVATEPIVTESAAVAPVATEPIIVEPAVAELAVAEPVVAAPVAAIPEKKLNERPFRVKLRGSVLVLVRLPNKRSLRAAIHQLSTSGGVIHLEKPLDEKLEVEMIFHIREATLRGKAQMLFPMWATQGWMQPFRFVNLSDADRETLDAKLKSFLGEPAKSAAAGA
jgi:hypothetical protein